MSRLTVFVLGLLLARSHGDRRRAQRLLREERRSRHSRLHGGHPRNPNDAVSYVNRGFEYLQKGDYARTLADYTKAIELDPASAGMRTRAAPGPTSGWARRPEALADAERSLQLKPRDARTLDIRGHILEALGRREEAIADYRRALAVEPRLKGSRDGAQASGREARERPSWRRTSSVRRAAR